MKDWIKKNKGLTIFFIVMIPVCIIGLGWLPMQQNLIKEQHTIIDKYTEVQSMGHGAFTAYVLLLDNNKEHNVNRSFYNQKNIGDTINITIFKWSWELNH